MFPRIDALRYAIYFTPAEDDPLAVAASRWLGYDTFSGKTVSFPETVALQPGRMREITAAASRYGFHATLKAPFRLAENVTSSALEATFDVFCRQQQAFDIPEIEIGELGHFFALVPSEAYNGLQAFAANVVEHFEPMRAPLTDEEFARRKQHPVCDHYRGSGCWRHRPETVGSHANQFRLGKCRLYGDPYFDRGFRV